MLIPDEKTPNCSDGNLRFRNSSMDSSLCFVLKGEEEEWVTVVEEEEEERLQRLRTMNRLLMNRKE